MTIQHHPDDASLLSYAAGSLPEPFEIVVSCHLQNCTACRERIREAEFLAGSLLLEVKPTELNRREQFLNLLDQDANNVSALKTPLNSLEDICNPTLPAPLQQLLSQGDINLPWQTLVPGIQQITLTGGEANLKLLKIAPNTKIPKHSHKGSEMTLVLEGNYQDDMGCYGPGDIADLSPEHQHQPCSDKALGCICLIATDAPLQFQGILPKLIQPFIDF